VISIILPISKVSFMYIGLSQKARCNRDLRRIKMVGDLGETSSKIIGHLSGKDLLAPCDLSNIRD
jgi:hypothetical protein